MSTALTDRQERFVLEYLIDQNARAAARRAGYSDNSSGSQARDLMRNSKVKERIREGLEELFSGLKITARNLLQQQARVAFFDPRKLFDATGEPIALDKLDEETASVLLVSYGKRKNGDWTQRVRQPSRMQALANLERRYLKFLEMQLDDEEEQEVKAPAAARRVPAVPAPKSAPPGKSGGILKSFRPWWLRDDDPAEEQAGAGAGSSSAPAAGGAPGSKRDPVSRIPLLKKLKDAMPAEKPREIPYHMQFAHLNPPNFAVLRDVPFEEWPANARKLYKVKPGAPEPLPPHLRRERPAYGDPGPIFRDDD